MHFYQHDISCPSGGCLKAQGAAPGKKIEALSLMKIRRQPVEQGFPDPGGGGSDRRIFGKLYFATAPLAADNLQGSDLCFPFVFHFLPVGMPRAVSPGLWAVTREDVIVIAVKGNIPAFFAELWISPDNPHRCRKVRRSEARNRE